MSSFTEPVKKSFFTWLDDAGQMLDLPRLEDESMHDYKQRLLDFVRNRSNASEKGTNNSLARSIGLNRTHVFTIGVIEGTQSPFIEVTSKYLRLFVDGVTEVEVDLYSSTMEAIKLVIEASTHFTVDYYDDNLSSASARKLCYGNNKDTEVQYLVQSKLNIIENTNIIDAVLSAQEEHIRGVSSVPLITKQEEYYLNKIDGLLYTGRNGSGYMTYSFYRTPYKLYYSPVTFFPLNDKDINKIIKDPVLTENGLEEKILNMKGARIVNELLAESPIHWGE